MADLQDTWEDLKKMNENMRKLSESLSNNWLG